MTSLSVNVNKIATLRNSRGNNLPNLEKVTNSIISFGADGITIHPRPDQRHINKLFDDISDPRCYDPILIFNFGLLEEEQKPLS